MGYWSATPSVLDAFSTSNESIDAVQIKSIRYAQKCMAICPLSSDNFCTGTQKCLMNGFMSAANVSSCTNQDCISNTICATLNASTITQCVRDSAELIRLFRGVWESKTAPGVVKQKTLAFAHGLQGCWKSWHSDWGLNKLISSLDTYVKSLNISDEATGYGTMLKKFTQQKLTFDWTAAYMSAKCKAGGSGPSSSPKAVVCRGHPTTSTLDSGKTDYLSGSTMTYPATKDPTPQTHCFFTNSVSSGPTDCTCSAGGMSDLAKCFDVMLDDHHGCPPDAICCLAEDATTHSTKENLLGSLLLEDLLIDNAASDAENDGFHAEGALMLGELLQTGYGGGTEC